MGDLHGEAAMNGAVTVFMIVHVTSEAAQKAAELTEPTPFVSTFRPRTFRRLKTWLKTWHPLQGVTSVELIEESRQPLSMAEESTTTVASCY